MKKTITSSAPIKRKSLGFTLLELALVLTIGGLMISAASSLLINYLQQAKINETAEKMARIDRAIREYLVVNNKLPCPAAYTVAPESALFGVEASTTCTDNVGTVTRVTGRPSAPNPNVKIGVLPVRSLNLLDSDMLDGWGNRFLYAVTERSASPGVFSATDGAIYVRDAGNNPVQVPDGTAQFIVISYGENGMGAFNANGVVSRACNAGATIEYNNCDNADAFFRATLLSSSVTGADSFDDIVYYNALPRPTDISNNLPSGTVAAFNLVRCPTDWTELLDARGRVIIGVGSYSENPAPGDRTAWSFNTSYGLMDIGGFARWAMNLNEMPGHSHDQRVAAKAAGGTGVYTMAFVPATGFTTTATGGSQAFENRQPYLSLLYCQKP